MIPSSTFSIDNLYVNAPGSDLAHGLCSNCDGVGGEQVFNFVMSNTTPEKFDNFVSLIPRYDIKNGNRLGYNALCIAAHKTNSLLISHLVLQKKAPVNLCNNFGLSPVHCAMLGLMTHFSVKKICSAINLLIELGADINLATKNKNVWGNADFELPALATPLWTAADLGLLPLIPQLISWGGKIYIPFSQRGRDNVLIAMKLHNMPLNQRFVRSLMEELGEIRKYYPHKFYHIDTSKLSKNDVALLLSHITITTTPSKFEKLCNDNNISSSSSSAIYAVTYKGNAQLMEYAISLVTSSNALDHSGASLMNKSIRSVIQPDLKVKLLLKLGASVNFSERSNRTPLWFAVEHGRIDCIKTLLLCGGKILRQLSPEGQMFVDAAIKGLFDKHKKFFWSKCRFLALSSFNQSSFLSELPLELCLAITFKFMAHSLVNLEENSNQEDSIAWKNLQDEYCLLQ